MIKVIFLKEIKELLRDRRTMMAMMVIPVLVFPLLLGLITTVTKNFEASQAAEVLKIGVTGDYSNQLLIQLEEMPETLGPKNIIPFQVQDKEDLKEFIRKDSLNIVLVFHQQEDTVASQRMEVFFQGTNIGSQNRATTYITILEEIGRNQKLAELGITPAQITPFEVSYVNVSTNEEMIGKIAGGFLPYIFIIFGFIGCMYPAIDLFTGEKERKTLETLLTAPVSRWKILVGKMLVVVTSGLLAAIFAIIGLFLAMEVFELVDDPELRGVIKNILNPVFIVSLLLLLIPLTLFFAGIMIPITVGAQSFKEAQSVLTPINFLVILPAIIGLLPGIELNYITAFIPIVNIVLATKELIAGSLELVLVGISFGTTVLFATLSVLVSYQRFGSEKNIVG